MRARNIKPGIFKNEDFGQGDPILMIVFMGLWCAADKEGRLEDRPLRLKVEILPYRENIDFNGYLTELSRLGHILRYEVDGERYIWVKKFKKHQRPHHTEKASEIPPPPDENEIISNGCDITDNSPLDNGENPPDSLIPDSLIPDSNNIGDKPQAPKDEKPEEPKRKKFIKPTVEQIAAYCIERSNNIDPQKFFDHYEANGWKRGKTPIKDWMACVRTWEGNNSGGGKQNGNSPTDFRQNGYYGKSSTDGKENPVF